MSPQTSERWGTRQVLIHLHIFFNTNAEMPSGPVALLTVSFLLLLFHSTVSTSLESINILSNPLVEMFSKTLLD